MKIGNRNKIFGASTERCQKTSQKQGDIKIMQGYSDGRKRLRIGKYRVIYQ